MGFTGFYRFLVGFTGFYCVLPGFSGFYWFLLVFTGFYRVLLGFTELLVDGNGFSWVGTGLQRFTAFHAVSQSSFFFSLIRSPFVS